MRLATAADSDFFLALRNDPVSVRFSATPKLVTPEAHATWFPWALATQSLYVEPGVATVRVDGEGWISIVVAEEHRGKGHGLRLLNAVMAREGRDRYLALVHKDNDASVRLFRRAGFIEFGDYLGGFMGMERRRE